MGEGAAADVGACVVGLASLLGVGFGAAEFASESEAASEELKLELADVVGIVAVEFEVVGVEDGVDEVQPVRAKLREAPKERAKRVTERALQW